MLLGELLLDFDGLVDALEGLFEAVDARLELLEGLIETANAIF